MNQSGRKRTGLRSQGTGFGKAIVPIVLVLLLTGLAGVCPAEQAKDSDILARWGKHVITKGDLDSRIKALPPDVQQQLEDPKIRRDFLESLIQIRMGGAEARAEKLDKKKKVTVRIQDMTDSILLQEYMNNKIASLKKPGDKEIEAFYQGHKADFTIAPMVKAQHILIKTEPKMKPEELNAARSKAEGILKEIAGGADFTQLVAKYSEDEGSRSQNGDLGLFTKDQMVAEFSDAAFSLKKGEVSKVVQTPFGFHIIKANDVVPEKQMELKDAWNSIMAKLDNENREKLVMGELERMKKKYKVKILMPAPAEDKAIQDK
jgi:peptidyl-prolyl cis-trans isomerase C